MISHRLASVVDVLRNERCETQIGHLVTANIINTIHTRRAHYSCTRVRFLRFIFIPTRALAALVITAATRRTLFTLE